MKAFLFISKGFTFACRCEKPDHWMMRHASLVIEDSAIFHKDRFGMATLAPQTAKEVQAHWNKLVNLKNLLEAA